MNLGAIQQTRSAGFGLINIGIRLHRIATIIQEAFDLEVDLRAVIAAGDRASLHDHSDAVPIENDVDAILIAAPVLRIRRGRPSPANGPKLLRRSRRIKFRGINRNRTLRRPGPKQPGLGPKPDRSWADALCTSCSPCARGSP